MIFVGDIVWSGWVFRNNLLNNNAGTAGKRGLWIEGVRDWPGGMDLRRGLVAVLDLAGDCLDCLQVVIHLRNELGETRISPPPPQDVRLMVGSFFVAEFNAFGIPTYTSEYIPSSHGNVNRNDNVI